MGTLLIANAALVVTMDDARTELTDCDILVRDGVIEAVGPGLAANEVDEMVDAAGCLVIPGLINSHNHVFGTLFRGAPHLHRATPQEWIEGVYRIVELRPLDSDSFRAAALAHFGKSLLTGCTLIADHHWLYQQRGPRDFVDREVEAALAIGIRLHVSRGCITRGGYVPEGLVEKTEDVLAHAQELIDRHHDPAPHSMLRVFLSPTGVHCDTEAVYRGMRELAEAHPEVQLHSHLYPGYEPRANILKQLEGRSTLDYMEDLGWVGDDVVFYHFTSKDPRDVERVARQGSWVSVCPAMDMRMSFAGPEGALPPIRELLDVSGRVAIGTSNQAMNEGTVLLHDMRVCWLSDRMRFSEPERWVTARDVLWMATRGGALALGRDDLGSIAPGMGADLAVFPIDGIEMACHFDPVPTLYGFTGHTRATIVNGRVVVRDGRLVSVDQDAVARDAHAASRLFAPGISWPPERSWSIRPRDLSS
ncbi:MAG: amidohydrolase family protein [Solirubrobacteraceae bacterium]|nr:amidohydrolase family protein [Solirubrobacteraceae bacterium]